MGWNHQLADNFGLYVVFLICWNEATCSKKTWLTFCSKKFERIIGSNHWDHFLRLVDGNDIFLRKKSCQVLQMQSILQDRDPEKDIQPGCCKLCFWVWFFPPLFFEILIVQVALYKNKILYHVIMFDPPKPWGHAISKGHIFSKYQLHVIQFVTQPDPQTLEKGSRKLTIPKRSPAKLPGERSLAGLLIPLISDQGWFLTDYVSLREGTILVWYSQVMVLFIRDFSASCHQPIQPQLAIQLWFDQPHCWWI